MENAGKQVRAYYESIRFDVSAALERWDVKAEIGRYVSVPADENVAAAGPQIGDS
jgi:hypothetical protein